MGFGVGIAMGPATVGTVGYEGRLDYTAVGNAVNLASRLCDLAADAQILVDPVVTGHVGDNVALASIGKRAIKGFDRAVEVFAVKGSVGLPLRPEGPFQPAGIRVVRAGCGGSVPKLSPADAA